MLQTSLTNTAYAACFFFICSMQRFPTWAAKCYNYSVAIKLWSYRFTLCGVGCMEVGVILYSLYAMFGGSAALVKLISVVELILAGGIAEVWHWVRREGNVSWGSDAAAGAWWATPWQRWGEKKHVCHVSVLLPCFPLTAVNPINKAYLFIQHTGQDDQINIMFFN